jgi:hypothetical protein
LTRRTVRDFRSDLDAAEIADAWARSHGLVLARTEIDGTRVYFQEWRLGFGNQRVGRASMIHVSRGLIVTVRQHLDAVHLEAWISAGDSSIPVLAPAEMGVEPGGFRGMFPRTKGRRIVDDLLGDFGQESVEGGTVVSGRDRPLVSLKPNQLSAEAAQSSLIATTPAGLRTVQDPELGSCSVIGPSRWWIVAAGMGIAGLAYVAWSFVEPHQAGVSPTWNQAIVIGLASLLFCVVSFSGKRTQLVIGQRGFRYVRPFRTVQASWGTVGESVLTGRHQITVPMLADRNASTLRISSDFSVAYADISELMNARRLASIGQKERGPG